MHMIRLARDPTLSQLAEKVVDKRLSDMFSSCGRSNRAFYTATCGLETSVRWVRNLPCSTRLCITAITRLISECRGADSRGVLRAKAKIPKAPGFEERAKLYRLYHYLNHYVMFGGGYYRECVNILKELA